MEFVQTLSPAAAMARTSVTILVLQIALKLALTFLRAPWPSKTLAVHPVAFLILKCLTSERAL